MADLPFGANLPWIEYGQDFGASAWRPQGGVSQPDLGERMRDALARLAGAGAQLVRWWLLADGRSGLVFDADGSLVGLDEHVFPDLDAALEALDQNGLEAIFVLTDFLWFSRARVVSGVQLGGRRGLVGDRDQRARLLESVLAPIARRYGREPTIAGWDLLNEPEWATFAVGTLNPFRSVSRRTMRDYLAEMVDAFRLEEVQQPLSVGLGRARSLSLAAGIGLDAYQVHWYEHQEPFTTLALPVAERGLDRPLLLGEFPTRGTSVGPGRVFEVALAAGYSGALAWSLLSRDDASDGDACAAALTAWSSRALAEP